MSFVKYIESKDGTLLYAKVQTTEVPETAKATIIIVHGLAEHLGRYDDIASVLIQKGFNVIRYDQRGHGHSSGENTFYSKVDEITDDLGAIVLYTRKLLPQQQVFVIGHSMGGYTAALYGTKYPRKIDGYITSGALTRYNHELFAGIPVGLDSNDYIKNELGEGLCSTEIVLKHYVEDALNKKEISVGLIRTLEKGIEYLKLEARDFKDPVLILHGENDGLVAVQDSVEFHDEISSEDKQLIIYPELEHEIFNEFTMKTEIFNTVISWIEERLKSAEEEK